VTGHRGVPPSEAAELHGLAYQAEQARAELGRTVAVLATMNGRPAGKELVRLAASAGAHRLRRAALRPLTRPGVAGLAAGISVLSLALAAVWLAHRGGPRHR
jgi:hypothetical protein